MKPAERCALCIELYIELYTGVLKRRRMMKRAVRSFVRQMPGKKAAIYGKELFVRRLNREPSDELGEQLLAHLLHPRGVKVVVHD